jgi:putative ABC transport system substrate-binding protein
MNRRDLLFLTGAAATARVAGAQQKPIPVIGYLDSASPGAFASYVVAFGNGLGETGFIERQNVSVEYRWAEGRLDQLPALATELVGRKVDVIVASGGFLCVLAAKNETSTIPIVFTGVSDPVGSGLVASLARPGANITDFSPFALELLPKRLELLTELVPEVRVIALLVNSNEPRAKHLIDDVHEAGRTKGVQVQALMAGTEGEIHATFVTLVQRHAQALLVSPDPFFSLRREQVVALAAYHAVPAAYPWREDARPAV